MHRKLKNKTRYFARMISIYHKVNDHIEMINDLKDLGSIPRENIIWIDLLGCGEKEELFLENLLGLQIMNNQESLEIEQSARVIEYQDHMIINSDFVSREGINLLPKIVSFTFDKNILISNRDYAFRSFHETSKKILTPGSKFGSSEVFLSIIDLRIANDADIVEELTRGVSELSKVIITEKHTSKEEILKLNGIRENLMLMMQNCIEKKFLISVIRKSPYLDQNTGQELDISMKDIDSVTDYIRFNFERLDYIDSTLNHLITYDQNNSIKLFTIFSVFFMPPTLIASIYGMNFNYIPELSWRYGYPFVWMFMLITVIATSIYFKRKKWL